MLEWNTRKRVQAWMQETTSGRHKKENTYLPPGAGAGAAPAACFCTAGSDMEGIFPAGTHTHTHNHAISTD